MGFVTQAICADIAIAMLATYVTIGQGASVWDQLHLIVFSRLQVVAFQPPVLEQMLPRSVSQLLIVASLVFSPGK